MNRDELPHGVRAIASDDVSGATDLTLRAADLLLQALGSPEAEAIIEGLLQAKPMMASLVNLACLARGQPAQAEARVRAFRDTLRAAPGQAAREAVALVSRWRGHGQWDVLTLSASRVVEETILALGEAGALASVVVAESRPRLEGEGLARRLGGRLPRVTVTHDAALPGLCTEASLVLLGADAVLPDAFVNKAGSLALCLAAREANARRVVLTTSHKVLLPEAASFFRLPPSRRGLRGGAPWAFLDIQFERVPLRLVDALVTEEGATGLPMATRVASPENELGRRWPSEVEGQEA